MTDGKRSAGSRAQPITITNTDRNHVERTLTTNNEGFYTATALPLGTYTIQVESGGFKTDAVTGIVLHANDAA